MRGEQKKKKKKSTNDGKEDQDGNKRAETVEAAEY
jgi:hypothetical protein